MESDPRFENVLSQFNGSEARKVNRAREVLRTVIGMEDKGETTGEYSVVDLTTRVTKDPESFAQKVGDYVKAFKAAGYTTTKRENNDIHHKGYRDVRGGRVSSSTTKIRTLHLKKI